MMVVDNVSTKIKFLPQSNLQNLNITWLHHYKQEDRTFVYSIGKIASNYFLKFNYAEFIINPTSNEISCYPNTSNQALIENTIHHRVIPLLLNHKDVDVIHASSILIGNKVIVLIGSSGHGKSTIAASLIKEGHKLIADDAVPLLLENNDIKTMNGLPKISLRSQSIELFPSHKKDFISKSKAIITLQDKEYITGSFKINYLYFLKPDIDTSKICIKKISKKETIVELIKSSHKLEINNIDMIKNQFIRLSKVAEIIEASYIIYPKDNFNPKEICFNVLGKTHANQIH